MITILHTILLLAFAYMTIVFVVWLIKQFNKMLLD